MEVTTGVSLVAVETSRQLQQIEVQSLCWESLPVPMKAGAGMWGMWQPWPLHSTMVPHFLGR